MEQKTPATTKLTLHPYSGDEHFVLNISEGLEKKIREFCALSPHREWSGVLFYTYESDETHTVINADDVFLMNQGTVGYTEYDLNEPEATRYMVMEGLIDHCIGHIHSHNTMKAFFSGEDTDTLIEHGTAMNNFVSLIVNNAGEYVARVTRRITVSGIEMRSFTGKMEYPLFNTDRVISKDITKEEKTPATSSWVEYADLEINKPTVRIEEHLERFGSLTQKSYCTPSSPHTQPFNPETSKGWTPPSLDGYENRKPVQGKLFEDDEDAVEHTITDLDPVQIEAIREIEWSKTGFQAWFNELLNGNPFDASLTSPYGIGSRYKNRFPTEQDFLPWFEMWVDFMVSDFTFPKDFNMRGAACVCDDEELLLVKTYCEICTKPNFVYKELILDTLLTRFL